MNGAPDRPTVMASLPMGYRAAVLGASGAIGGAIADRLATDRGAGEVLRLGRSLTPSVDVTDPDSLAAAAAGLGELDLLFIATGGLTIDGARPEKALSQVNADALMAQFALNAAGPMLALSAFRRALPRRRRVLVAALSARVGSVGDNRLGGWYGYRAAKAALNQFWKTASIELRRTHPEAVLAVLHPGTVESPLSQPFRPEGAENPDILTPDQSAERLLTILDGLSPEDTGAYRDWKGSPIPW